MRIQAKLAAGLSIVLAASADAAAGPADFRASEPVVIEGYDGHAMEPFLSRDGALLFFNNRNQPKDETDLHVAERIDDRRFRYLGPLDGANSEDLDGVPSMDRAGRFYFVSPRAYGETRNTLWTGEFSDGALTNVQPLRGDVSRDKPFWLNIDAEISADGETLYFVENRWRIFGGGVKSANIFAARRDETGAFIRLPNVSDLFKEINTEKLEFAPSVTEDELTLYFTRVDKKALRRSVDEGFGLFVSTRPSIAEPFGPPERIEAVRGYVEGPTVSPDACAIYFHQRVDEVFEIRRAERADCDPGRR